MFGHACVARKPARRVAKYYDDVQSLPSRRPGETLRQRGRRRGQEAASRESLRRVGISAFQEVVSLSCAGLSAVSALGVGGVVASGPWWRHRLIMTVWSLIL